MLADRQDRSGWAREGGPFDMIAICVSLIVIVGAFFLVNSASMQYRFAGAPVASAGTVLAPLVMRDPGEAQ